MKRYAILFITAITILACKKKDSDAIQATVGTISESVYASGYIKSKNQYQVFSTTNGIIQELLVTEGDTVKKGDPILFLLNEASRLNTENARLAAEFAALNTNKEKLNELKLRIDLAKSQMLNDSLLLKRQENLWSQQIGTKVELEQQILKYNNSVVAYQTAVLKYSELKKQLSFSEQQSNNNLRISSSNRNDYIIRSNIDGKVYSLLKKQGELVNTQSPVAIIGSADQFIIELQVDEYDVTKIKLFQKVYINMDSYKGKTFEAIISKIYPIMNERSRSFLVEAIFTSAPPTLYPYLTVESNILIKQKENALIIPRNYLVSDSLVLLEDGSTKKVTLGLMDYQKVEVTSGITSKDFIYKPSK
jgi:HlyD family secretion protein